MRLRRFLFSPAVLCLALPALAATAKDNFTLLQKGKVVGRASYTIDRNKDGSYRVRTSLNTA